ncbi:MAG: site-specific integrase [Lachnospiraceae bacterium]|nr:site-specific integrase [Lachnospiraceae bacterium]
MSIHKDDQRNTWYISIYYKDWTGARKKKFKRGFATKKEAQKYEADFLAKASCSSGIRFDKLVEYYFENLENRVRKSTYINKSYIIKDKILPYFGERITDSITPADIRRWQDDLIRRGYADTYLHTIQEQLSAIFNYAVKYYDLPKNPCVAAGSMGKGFASEMEIWTIEEFYLFIESMRDRPAAFIAFMILFWTGLRLGEMLALTISDIDLERRTLRVNKSLQHIQGFDIITEPKTPKSNRIISIPEVLALELSAYMDSLSNPSSDTRLVLLSKNLLEKLFKRGIRKTGVKDIHIHCLRHSHTAIIASLGASPVEAAERLGHENVHTTLNIYTHVLPGRQQIISDELDKLYKKTKGGNENEGDDEGDLVIAN